MLRLSAPLILSPNRARLTRIIWEACLGFIQTRLYLQLETLRESERGERKRGRENTYGRGMDRDGNGKRILMGRGRRRKQEEERKKEGKKGIGREKIWRGMGGEERREEREERSRERRKRRDAVGNWVSSSNARVMNSEFHVQLKLLS